MGGEGGGDRSPELREYEDGRSARRQISCDRQVDNAGYTRDSIDSTFAQ